MRRAGNKQKSDKNLNEHFRWILVLLFILASFILMYFLSLLTIFYITFTNL